MSVAAKRRFLRLQAQALANDPTEAVIKAIDPTVDPKTAWVEVDGQVAECRVFAEQLLEVGATIYVQRNTAVPGLYYQQDFKSAGTNGASAIWPDPGDGSPFAWGYDEYPSGPVPGSEVVPPGEPVAPGTTVVDRRPDTTFSSEDTVNWPIGETPVASPEPRAPRPPGGVGGGGYGGRGSIPAPRTPGGSSPEPPMPPPMSNPISHWPPPDPLANIRTQKISAWMVGHGSGNRAAHDDHIHPHGELPVGLVGGWPAGYEPHKGYAYTSHEHTIADITDLGDYINPGDGNSGGGGGGGGGSTFNDDCSAQVDGVTQAFSTRFLFEKDSLQVAWNGIVLRPGAEFTENVARNGFTLDPAILPLTTPQTDPPDTMVAYYSIDTFGFGEGGWGEQPYGG